MCCNCGKITPLSMQKETQNHVISTVGSVGDPRRCWWTNEKLYIWCFCYYKDTPVIREIIVLKKIMSLWCGSQRRFKSYFSSIVQRKETNTTRTCHITLWRDIPIGTWKENDTTSLITISHTFLLITFQKKKPW